MARISRRRAGKEAAAMLIAAALIEIMVVAFLLSLDLEAARHAMKKPTAAPWVADSAPDVCASVATPCGAALEAEQ